MSMFFRSKKPSTPGSFSSLGVDLHSHLIPGIDDGVRTVEESLTLIRRLAAMGFRKIYTTPHVMADHYPNTRERILEGRDLVLEGLRARRSDSEGGDGIEFGAAAEYFLDERFEELLQNGDLLTLPGDRVLVEMAGVAPASNLLGLLFRMQTKGYKPVLAHPERYPYYWRDFKAIERLKEQSCEFQLNLLSLTGHYGSQVREQAFKLLKLGMIDFLATDMHHEQHADKLEAALQDKKVRKVLDGNTFKNARL
ncbi:MAG: hypothetical protein H6563_03175 [Lewinellaceae bacterium]|nr:hypothetical protein [Lewinellaceae bacterium]